MEMRKVGHTKCSASFCFYLIVLVMKLQFNHKNKNAKKITMKYELFLLLFHLHKLRISHEIII